MRDNEVAERLYYDFFVLEPSFRSRKVNGRCSFQDFLEAIDYRSVSRGDEDFLNFDISWDIEFWDGSSGRIARPNEKIYPWRYERISN